MARQKKEVVLMADISKLEQQAVEEKVRTVRSDG